MIKIKILDILNKKERNLNWLATNAGITYSTLYNFAHQNTSSVTYDILEKVCETLRCDVCDIIEYIPEGVNILPESNLEILNNIIDTLIEKQNQNKEISEDEQRFLYQMFIKTIKGHYDIKTADDAESFAKAYTKCSYNNLLPNDLMAEINMAIWNIPDNI